MNKKKIAGIIAGCIVVIIVIVVIATRPPTATTPAQNYTLTTHISPSGAGFVSPSGGEYESGVQVTLTASPASDYTFDYWSSALGKTYTTTITITVDSDKSLTAHFETIVPTHFTTYTDELSLFSISYPPEWEPLLEYIEELEQYVEDIMSSITSDLPMEETYLLFAAGLPTIEGYMPNVNITVGPSFGQTHDETVTAGIEGVKELVSDYHEFSRVKTTVGNRTATIIEWQGTIPGLSTLYYVQMNLLVSKTAWCIGCTALPDEYSEWEDDLDAIVRSLRILK